MSKVIAAAAARAAIVAAVDGQPIEWDGTTVALAGHPTNPAVPAPFDVWPVLVDGRPFTMGLSELDFHVYVAIPAADQETTVSAGDVLVDEVAYILMTRGDGKVNHTRPARWTVADGHEIPVWQFEITI